MLADVKEMDACISKHLNSQNNGGYPDGNYLIIWVNRRAGNKTQLSWQKTTSNNEKTLFYFEKTGKRDAFKKNMPAVSFSENCHREYFQKILS